jgi:hypothetical protein
MGIELKTLIEDTCRQFERNFSTGNLARLAPVIVLGVVGLIRAIWIFIECKIKRIDFD